MATGTGQPGAGAARLSRRYGRPQRREPVHKRPTVALCLLGWPRRAGSPVAMLRAGRGRPFIRRGAMGSVPARRGCRWASSSVRGAGLVAASEVARSGNRSLPHRSEAARRFSRCGRTVRGNRLHVHLVAALVDDADRCRTVKPPEISPKRKRSRAMAQRQTRRSRRATPRFGPARSRWW